MSFDTGLLVFLFLGECGTLFKATMIDDGWSRIYPVAVLYANEVTIHPIMIDN